MSYDSCKLSRRHFPTSGASLFHVPDEYVVCRAGERQSWAAPSVPNVQIVDNSEPLKKKPYGTFTQQYTPAKTSEDKQSSKPTSEELTSNGVTSADESKDLDVDTANDDSVNGLRRRETPVTGSDS